MKKILVLAAIFFTGICFAQTEIINKYKYVILPEKFEFLNQANKYNLNTLAKGVFVKQGFTVFMSNEKLPDVVALDKCKALYGDVKSSSGMLATVLNFEIKDCNGKILYTSEKGRSKVKEFQKAYYEAMREAAASFASLDYKYDESASVTGQGSLVSKVTVRQEPQTQPAQATAQVTAIPINNQASLFAQPITNGYQLVDTTPKVVVKMYKTSQADYYTAQGDGKNGVIFKRGNDWFFEYYLNDKLVSEKLTIKF
jgi:hypothetical protein